MGGGEGVQGRNGEWVGLCSPLPRFFNFRAKFIKYYSPDFTSFDAVHINVLLLLELSEFDSVVGITYPVFVYKGKILYLLVATNFTQSNISSMWHSSQHQGYPTLFTKCVGCFYPSQAFVCPSLQPYTHHMTHF